MEMFQQGIEEGQSQRIQYFVLASTTLNTASIKRYVELCAGFGLFEPFEPLSFDYDIEEEECLLLSVASARNPDKVNSLINDGHRIDQFNEEGQTLLMIAAEWGFLDTVRICLEKGSQEFVNMKDKTKRNAVVYACEKKRSACLEEILKNKKTVLDEANIRWSCKPVKSMIMCEGYN